MQVALEGNPLFYVERYRSGHNGTDSKSVEPHGSVGSNPTRSATPAVSHVAHRRFFILPGLNLDAMCVPGFLLFFVAI